MKTKKIVFVDVPMKNLDERNADGILKNAPQNYADTGNAGCAYERPVHFAINAVLAEKLRTGDDVKVVLLMTEKADGYSEVNAGKFMEELRKIVSEKKIDVQITYETVSHKFEEEKENQEIRFRDIIGKLEKGAGIFADITFGPRTLPMVLMSALGFAEKFFSCDIRNIVYGKVEFDNKGIAHNPELYDITSLYYLDGLIHSMEAKDGESAVKALDEFFAL